MKKTLLALAVLGSFAGAASAQSSVTLSGAVDVGVQRKDGKTAVEPANSGRTNFTIQGTEDLGNGMKATFLLNHRFKADTGAINVSGNPTTTTPTYFWRNSWVGLGGDMVGDVRLGRMLMPLQEFNGGFEPWGGGDTVANVHTGGIKATARATNALYYRSPKLAGLQLHLAGAEADDQIAGECDSCSVAVGKRPVGAGLRFDGGPVSVAVAYDKNVADLKTLALYGKFNAGFATVMFQYEKGEVSAASNAKDGKRFSISGTVPVGPATIKAGYLNMSEEGVGTSYKDSRKRLGLGVDYSLSKRTVVYADIAKNQGDGWTDANKKVMYDLGIWHKF